MTAPLLAVALALVGTSPASRPLLTKIYTVQFAPENMRVANICEVYADHVQIRTSRGGADAEITVSQPVAIGGSIDRVIADAARGPIERQLGPTDHPVDSYAAYADDSDAEIDLGTKQSAVFTVNRSPSAQRLRRLLDSLCPAQW